MKYFLTLIMILLNPSCKSTGGSGSSPKVIGGENFSGLPSVGVIVKFDGGKAYPHCTGTFVGNKKVVTAAHCISHEKTKAGDLQFRVGSSFDTPDKSYNIAEIHPHPLYDGFSYDIGYVILDQDPDLIPMKILERNLGKEDIDKDIFVVGYGRSVSPEKAPFSKSGAGVKRSLLLKIQDLSKSKLYYNIPGRSKCKGDSGGPTFLKEGDNDHVLAAVTSCGDSKCLSYGADTRMDLFREFVLNGNTDSQELDARCNGVSLYGECRGNQAVWCEGDCFKREYLTDQCTGNKKCQTHPSSRLNRCYDSDLFKSVTLKISRTKVTSSEDPKLDYSEPLKSAFVFIDPPAVNEMMVGGGTPSTDNEGLVTIKLEKGSHRIYIMRQAFGRGLERVGGVDFVVGDEGNTIPINVPFETVILEADYQTNIGESIYVAGATPLLGDWKKAKRMNFDVMKKRWVTKLNLPRNLPYKFLLGPWKEEEEVDVSEDFSWQQGDDLVIGASTNPFQSTWQESFTPVF